MLIVLSWLALATLAVLNLLLGRALPRPPVKPHAPWQERPWYEGRTRLLVATAGAAVLSTDLAVIDPAWLQLLVVALPAFVLGALIGRRHT